MNKMSGRVGGIFLGVPRRTRGLVGLVYKASHKCHSERSEESLMIYTTLLHLTKQRCFASLDVTAPLYGIGLCVYELVTRQAAKCLEVFCRRLLDHILRQTWRRRSLVPIERLQIIAHELFVEAGRALSDDVFIFRPEPRRVRGEALIDQKKFSIDRAKLEFR